MFKKLFVASLVAVALCGWTFQSQAATASSVSTVASTNSIITSNAVQISQVVVANAGAGTMLVNLYDAPDTNLTYVRAAYTNTLSYTTNMVTTFTNFSGVVQSNTNLVLFTYSSVAPQATNTYRLLTTISVPASSTYTWTPSGNDGIYANFGVTSTVNTNGTVTVYYNSAR